MRLGPVRPTAKTRISSKRRSTGSSKRDQVDAPR
jgi:hypothetical protein